MHPKPAPNLGGEFGPGIGANNRQLGITYYDDLW